MEHDKKKQEHRFRTLFHSLLLFVEIISVSVFLWGQRTSQTSVVTPEFSWDHYETIAHALAGSVIKLISIPRRVFWLLIRWAADCLR